MGGINYKNMKMITFRKLYKRVTEEDEGYVIDAIVAFKKVPWQRGVEGSIQYQYYLLIDLWLVRMSFMWEGKEEERY